MTWNIYGKAPVGTVIEDGHPEGIMARILEKSWEIDKCKLNYLGF